MKVAGLSISLFGLMMGGLAVVILTSSRAIHGFQSPRLSPVRVPTPRIAQVPVVAPWMNLHQKGSSSSLYSSSSSSSSSSTSNTRNRDTRDFDEKFDDQFPIIDEEYLDEEMQKSLVSAAAICLLDIAFRAVFNRWDLTFPSSLAGMGALLLTMLAVGKDTGKSMYNFFNPGARLLAKWLPVFFVPSLIILPLTSAITTATGPELFKVGVVLGGGFLISLLGTAWAVNGVRKGRREDNGGDDRTVDDKRVEDFKEGAKNVGDFLKDAAETVKDSVQDFAERRGEKDTPRMPFEEDTLNRWTWVAGVTGAVSLIPGLAGIDWLEVPLRTLFMLATTMATYVFGARLDKDFKDVVHPIVTCTLLTWAVAAGYAAAIGTTFRGMLRQYIVGARMTQWKVLGAGDLLLWLLGPAVVSFAVSIYGRRKLIKQNGPEITTAVTTGTLSGLFGTALLGRLVNIGNPMWRLSLLSRSVTSPLAMTITAMLGADIPLAVALTVITGVLGASFGANILNNFEFEDQVARGLSMGAAGHGLGTAALFDEEKKAFPFAALSMALTAAATTIAVTVPPIKRALLSVALGGL
jgi:putative effector of murein hydrolase/putative effector of murein hydrolase LrgA (UPF0299 family)